MRSKRVVEGTTLGVGVLVLAAILGMVNYLGGKYYRRFDWTSTRLYTLSEKTLGVLAGLDRDVEVTLFMRPNDPLYDPVRELLERYQSANSKFHARTVDPDRNLLEAQRLAARGVSSPNVVVFEAGDERRVIEPTDLADYDYSRMQYGEQPRMTGLKAEQRFTSAILELVENRKPKILFTAGHGEATFDDATGRGLGQARALLGRDNFTLDSWSTLGKTAVPEATDLVVIAGPTSAFTLPELAMIGGYLESGGRLLVLLDPVLPAEGASAAPAPDAALTHWLESYGVEVGNDVVVDPTNPLPLFGAETIYSTIYGVHPATKALQEAAVPVILSLSRSVRRSATPAGEREMVELVNTSPEGWAETDLAHLQQVARDERDVAGPVALAVAVSDSATEEMAAATPSASTSSTGPESATSPANSSPVRRGFRLVVFGDSDWARDAQLGNAGNATLFADTFNWLVERPQLLGIAAKAPESSRLNLSLGELRTVFAVVLGGMPLAAIVAGVWTYLRRRR